MATVTDRITQVERGVTVLTCDIVFDDVTGNVSRVEATAGPRDVSVVIYAPGQNPLPVNIAAGRTVRRNNVPGAYNRFSSTWTFG